MANRIDFSPLEDDEEGPNTTLAMSENDTERIVSGN